MSEASGNVSQTIVNRIKPGSVGELLPIWEARVSIICFKITLKNFCNHKNV